MSAPFVGCRVTVIGTSKEQLNGLHGVATSFDSDKGRYNVRLDNGETFSLKPANVDRLPGGNPDQDGDAAPGGMPDMSKLFAQMGLGGPQLAEAQRQMAGLQRMAKEALPAGVEPTHAAMGVGAVVVFTIYFLVSKERACWDIVSFSVCMAR
jgi:hypothetical protein